MIYVPVEVAKNIKNVAENKKKTINFKIDGLFFI